MNILEVIDIVQRGESEAYLNRFVGAVKFAAATGQPVPLDIDDALVAAMALVRLVQTGEGRKLLGLPKRKNTQYKARDYLVGSPQSEIAREYLAGNLDRRDAILKLDNTFVDPPDERTLGRLLDDLAANWDEDLTAIDIELIAHGASPDVPGSRQTAARKMFKQLAGSDWLEKIEAANEQSDSPEKRKAKARAALAALIKGKNSSQTQY